MLSATNNKCLFADTASFMQFSVSPLCTPLCTLLRRPKLGEEFQQCQTLHRKGAHGQMTRGSYIWTALGLHLGVPTLVYKYGILPALHYAL